MYETKFLVERGRFLSGLVSVGHNAAHYTVDRPQYGVSPCAAMPTPSPVRVHRSGGRWLDFECTAGIDWPAEALKAVSDGAFGPPQ
jgi:hypothetical protein